MFHFRSVWSFISKSGATLMSDTAESLRTSEGRFSPGQSGNPAGRPKGSRNKATLVAEALLDEATGPVVAKAIDEALAGDGAMLRTVFQAICKKDPGRTIELDIPEGSWGDPVVFLEATMRAVALGEITPQEAALLARLASVMVQAQRLRLRIRQREGKPKADRDPARVAPGVAAEPAPAARVPSDASAARVDDPDKPRHDNRGTPVSHLYPRSSAADASIRPVSAGHADACIAPVDSQGEHRRKAA
jgi:hypothetical protein